MIVNKTHLELAAEKGYADILAYLLCHSKETFFIDFYILLMGVKSGDV